jgi:hypothetical protein
MCVVAQGMTNDVGRCFGSLAGAIVLPGCSCRSFVFASRPRLRLIPQGSKAVLKDTSILASLTI